jgi:hypothetical protein
MQNVIRTRCKADPGFAPPIIESNLPHKFFEFLMDRQSSVSILTECSAYTAAADDWLSQKTPVCTLAVL